MTGRGARRGRRVARLAATLAAWMVCAAGCAPRPEEPGGEVTVFAAAGTTGPIRRVAERFRRAGLGTARISLHASSTLAGQIAAGAPAHVFLSAHPRWVDHLVEEGFARRGDCTDLLGNALSLIAPRESDWTVSPAPSSDLASAFVGPLAVGEVEHVPVGIYAAEAMRSLGWWDALVGRLVQAHTTKAVLRFVETKQAAAGIVYRSDAVSSRRVRIVADLPGDAHAPIRFVAALLEPDHATARAFYDYLRSPEARDIFRSAGFEPLGEPAALPARSAEASTVWWGLSSREWSALRVSLAVASAAVAVAAVPGVALGVVLARGRFRGKGLLDAMVHAPLVMPPVATGYLLLLTLGRNGPVGGWLERWLGWRLAFTWQAAVAASAVMGLPLLVRGVRLAVELVDRRLEQAAATLGASRARVFATVTLPLALPGVISGLVLAFARSLGEFGATATFAGNVDGVTRTLPLAVYTLTQTPDGQGAAFRLVAISLAVSLAALGASEALSRRARRRAAEG